LAASRRKHVTCDRPLSDARLCCAAARMVRVAWECCGQRLGMNRQLTCIKAAAKAGSAYRGKRPRAQE
jgi:hypothetical protein